MARFEIETEIVLRDGSTLDATVSGEVEPEHDGELEAYDINIQTGKLIVEEAEMDPVVFDDLHARLVDAAYESAYVRGSIPAGEWLDKDYGQTINVVDVVRAPGEWRWLVVAHDKNGSYHLLERESFEGSDARFEYAGAK